MNAILDFNRWAPLTEAVAPVLLDAALKGVAVMALAALAVAFMRRRSAAARHLVWFLAVASLLVLPLLSWALPGWHVLPPWMALKQAAPKVQVAVEPNSFVPQPRFQDVAERGPVITTPAHAAPELPVPRQLPTQASQPQPASQMRVARHPWFLAMATWLAGAVLVLLPMVGGMYSLWNLERHSRTENSPAWLELLRRLLACLGFHRCVALLKSAQRRMPMTWGVLRPRLLLPDESENWPDEQRRVVMLHELAHVKRRDYLTNLLTRLACALHWFNPLVWLAARQMLAEREQACDDIVLAHGAKPADYAEQVLQVAAGLPVGRFAACGAIAMARPSKLEGRVRAILDSQRNRAVLTRWAVVLALALLAAALVPVAMLKASSDEVPSRPAQRKEWGWGTSTNGLQSRIVLERDVFKQGEPIVAKILVTNVTDKPVRYDARGTNSWQVFPPGPGGKPAVDISAWRQVSVRYEKYEFPTLGPGQEIEAAAIRLDRQFYYMVTPGKYRISWPGTKVGTAEPWTDFLMDVGADPEPAKRLQAERLRAAQAIAVGLPPVEPVEIEVVRTQGAFPVGEAILRILAVLPPAWRIDGTRLEADAVQPAGRQAGRGSVFHLRHSPCLGALAGKHAALELYVMGQPAEENPAALTNGISAAEYLGKSPLGFVYLAPIRPRERLAEPVTPWNHASYDIATALSVRDPASRKPAGPDWGRMVCQILSEAAAQSRKPASLFQFCIESETATVESGKPVLHYESNLIPGNKARPPAREKSDKPFYRVSINVSPISEHPRQFDLETADKSIAWDGASSTRGYRVKRLGVEIVLEVLSDDREFVQSLNAILDRAVTSVLSGGGAAANSVPEAKTPPAQSTSSPEPGWGESVEGVSARLCTERTNWAANATPMFTLDLQNQGQRQLSMFQSPETGRLEVDGIWHRWTGAGSWVQTPFPPRRLYEDIPLALAPDWRPDQDKSVNPQPPPHSPLKLLPGPHTVRLALRLTDTNAPRTKRAPILKPGEKAPWFAVTSNPVRIEVTSSNEALAATGAKWGTPVEGVSVHLRAEHDAWTVEEAIRFFASVQNQGQRNLSVAQGQALGELEFDGVWYHWGGVIDMRSSAFPPSRRYDNIPVTLPSEWVDKDNKPLRLTPARHTIRFAAVAEAWPIDLSGTTKPIRAVSNPVQVNLVPGVGERAALVSKYLPGYALRAVRRQSGEQESIAEVLVTPAGEEKNLAAMRGEWRGIPTILPPTNSPRAISFPQASYMRNAQLTAFLSPLKLKIANAAEAEDITRVLFGLFKGPWSLANRAVQAKPGPHGWVVTTEYVGPPAQVMYQGPLELILDDGLLRDAREREGMTPQPVAVDKQASIAEPGWGEAVDGLCIRLQADKPVFYLSQGVALRLSVRNLGNEAFAVLPSQEHGELELDGAWYSWSENSFLLREPLAPNQQLDNLAVTPSSSWSKDSKRLWAGAGKHTIRFAITARRDDASRGQTLRAVSAPVEVLFRFGVPPEGER